MSNWAHFLAFNFHSGGFLNKCTVRVVVVFEPGFQLFGVFASYHLGHCPRLVYSAPSALVFRTKKWNKTREKSGQ